MKPNYMAQIPDADLSALGGCIREIVSAHGLTEPSDIAAHLEHEANLQDAPRCHLWNSVAIGMRCGDYSLHDRQCEECGEHRTHSEMSEQGEICRECEEDSNE